MSTTKNAKSAAQAAPLWTDLRRSDVDTGAPLTLFDLETVDNSTRARKADRCGTPDMFAAAEAAEAAPPARSAVTPGFKVRVMIFFKVQGETRVAYRWSPLAMRAIRVPLADALTWQATDAADVIPGHPLKP